MKTALGLDGLSVKYVYLELYGLDAVNQDRERINAYKYFLKHLSPPIKLSETWLQVRQRIKDQPEFENVPHEEDREIYFLKFRKWLGKHEEDVEVKQEVKKSRWDRKLT
jgi:pre-mRNA-processing factor 40